MTMWFQKLARIPLLPVKSKIHHVVSVNRFTSLRVENKTMTSLLKQPRQIQKKLMMATHTIGNASLCRQNYHEECEAVINKQINMELYASFVYMSMAYYFDREDVALDGFHNFFKENSDEEREHAEMFMKYQNDRGGRIILQPISKPTRDEWEGPLEAVTAALELEKTVNQMFFDILAVADRHSDSHLSDYIEDNFLEEQVKAIKELSDHITNIKRVDKGLGEYVFAKNLKTSEP